jgi:aspartyl protease family protein
MMQIPTDPAWRQLAALALGAAVLLSLLFSIPRIGPVLRSLFSLGLLALGIFVVLQQAPYHPALSQLATRLGLDRQQVVGGGAVRIRMSPDGHFWALVDIAGAERRMLIDSGATVTALSEETARLAGVTRDPAALPIVIRTANGDLMAATGTIPRLSFGSIEARNLKVVIAPGMRGVDILGMNFLSQLASWRVEGRTLILSPKSPPTGGPELRGAPA